MTLSELTPNHWRVIRYLRQHYDERHEVPTVFQACEDNGLELEELERLFPGGYHRGAVKLAGLHVL
jgi:tRNA 2-thiouridine synthesizing protein E